MFVKAVHVGIRLGPINECVPAPKLLLLVLRLALVYENQRILPPTKYFLIPIRVLVVSDYSIKHLPCVVVLTGKLEANDCKAEIESASVTQSVPEISQRPGVQHLRGGRIEQPWRAVKEEGQSVQVFDSQNAVHFA